MENKLQGKIFNAFDEEYIVARVGRDDFTLINLRTGNRFFEPKPYEHFLVLLRNHGFSQFVCEEFGLLSENSRVVDLRRNGFKVRVIHQRAVKPLDYELTSVDKEAKVGYFKADLKPNEKGGKTRVEIRLPNGKEIVGEATCHPDEHYNKKEGVKQAIKNAYENYIG